MEDTFEVRTQSCMALLFRETSTSIKIMHSVFIMFKICDYRKKKVQITRKGLNMLMVVPLSVVLGYFNYLCMFFSGDNNIK